MSLCCLLLGCHPLKYQVQRGRQPQGPPPASRGSQKLPTVNSTRYRQRGPSPPRFQLCSSNIQLYNRSPNSVLSIEVLSVRLMPLLTEANQNFSEYLLFRAFPLSLQGTRTYYNTYSVTAVTLTNALTRQEKPSPTSRRLSCAVSAQLTPNFQSRSSHYT